MVGYIPHHTDDEYFRDVYLEGSNDFWYTEHRCCECLVFSHPRSFEGQDIEYDVCNLVCDKCETKQQIKAHKEWLRDWHQEDSKKVTGKSWTGKEFEKYKKEHSFECEKCWCMKKQTAYNYAQVEKAMERREQPTCSQCLPDVPEHIHKLKVAEIKLYLDGWKRPPVEKGTQVKELRTIFQKACKKRLQKNFFMPQKKRGVGVKDPTKTRSLKVSSGYKKYVLPKDVVRDYMFRT